MLSLLSALFLSASAGQALVPDGRVFKIPVPSEDSLRSERVIVEAVRMDGRVLRDTFPVVLPAAVEFSFQDTGRLVLSADRKSLARLSGDVRWAKDREGNFLEMGRGGRVAFDSLIDDGRPEGALEVVFRPDDEFFAAPARTIFGDDEARLHIGWSQGRLFFQKNDGNRHRFVVTPAQALRRGRWQTILATWGPRGMTISVDGHVLAWNADTSGYHVSMRRSVPLAIGGKSGCCMEPLGVNSPIDASGGYRRVRLLPTQPMLWPERAPHASSRNGREDGQRSDEDF